MQLQAVNGKRSIEKFEGIRRFAIPDLQTHGGWVLNRLQKIYPHLHEVALASYLQSMVDNNDFLFLYQPNSIALVQLERGYTVSPRPVVRERYVFARDPGNSEHVAEAATFYDHIKQWARHLEVEFVILSDMSDVPIDKIKMYLGKTFEKQVTYARV